MKTNLKQSQMQKNTSKYFCSLHNLHYKYSCPLCSREQTRLNILTVLEKIKGEI